MNRVMLVDEYDVTLRGLKELLKARPRLEVVAEARTAQEALVKARQAEPDIAILSYSLPELNGRELMMLLLQALPTVEVLIYSMYKSETLVLDMLQAGASGVVLKTDREDQLLAAVDALRLGRRYISPTISADLVASYERKRRKNSRGGVTSREREIMQLIAEGMINKQIAGILNVSPKTVETHRASIMTKLNLRNTAEVVRYAIRNSIVTA